MGEEVPECVRVGVPDPERVGELVPVRVELGVPDRDAVGVAESADDEEELAVLPARVALAVMVCDSVAVPVRDLLGVLLEEEVCSAEGVPLGVAASVRDCVAVLD